MAGEVIQQVVHIGAPIIALIALALFVVVSVVLEYHWREYRVRSATRAFVRIVYYSGGVGLLVVAFFALIPLF